MSLAEKFVFVGEFQRNGKLAAVEVHVVDKSYGEALLELYDVYHIRDGFPQNEEKSNEQLRSVISSIF